MTGVIVRTGRHALGRVNSAAGRAAGHCQSCAARLYYGDPEPGREWPSKLRLTPKQHDLLLMAAAEWLEIGGGDAVEFVDWLAVDVLGRHPRVHPEADGAPPHNENGTRSNEAGMRHRHPDPIPYIGRSYLRSRGWEE